MSYSYNVFESTCNKNISADSAFPTLLVDPISIPNGGHAVILSVIACNKDGIDSYPLTLAIQKVDSSTNCMVCKEVPIPINSVKDVFQGTKIVLNREDQFKAWTSPQGFEKIDLTVSYAIYTPSSLSTC